MEGNKNCSVCGKEEIYNAYKIKELSNTQKQKSNDEAVGRSLRGRINVIYFGFRGWLLRIKTRVLFLYDFRHNFRKWHFLVDEWFNHYKNTYDSFLDYYLLFREITQPCNVCGKYYWKDSKKRCNCATK